MTVAMIVSLPVSVQLRQESRWPIYQNSLYRKSKNVHREWPNAYFVELGLFTVCTNPDYRRANFDEETTNLRPVRGRTAHTVRREGWGNSSLTSGVCQASCPVISNTNYQILVFWLGSPWED